MSRTLDEWLAYQQTVHARGIDMGLERVREVWRRLGARDMVLRDQTRTIDARACAFRLVEDAPTSLVEEALDALRSILERRNAGTATVGGPAGPTCGRGM